MVFLLGAILPVQARETGIRVKKDGTIHTVPLERYVEGVLMGEVPADWPLEALKAQAVAVRTYTLFRKQTPRSRDYDLEATVNDQVFSSSREVPASVHEAVMQTRGELLKKEDLLVPAYFHSCCGGQTEDPAEVWGRWTPHAAKVVDSYCQACPYTHWEYKASKEDLQGLLRRLLADKNVDLSERWSLLVRERTAAHRVKTLVLKVGGLDYEIEAQKFRRTVGYSQLRSNWYDVVEDVEDIRFVGHGFGHGVGLCQWGAKGMAGAGFDYRAILQFYYPEAVIDGSASQAPQPEIPVDVSDVIDELMKNEEAEAVPAP